MTKSLTEESIEKTNVPSPKETKQNTFFFLRTFLSERKQWKDIFISTHWNRWKSVEEKQLSWSFKFSAAEKSTNRSWKWNLPSVLLNLWNKRKSSTLKNLFSSFSISDFKQKIFKSNIKWKDFLEFKFSKFTRRKIRWTMFESKTF